MFCKISSRCADSRANAVEVAPRLVDDKPPELVSALPVDPRVSPSSALLFRCLMSGSNLRSFCSISSTISASIFVASCFGSGDSGDTSSGCPSGTGMKLSLFGTRVLDRLDSQGISEDAFMFTLKFVSKPARSKG